MAFEGGRRLTQYLRPPVGTVAGATPFVDSNGLVTWGTVFTLPVREDIELDALDAPSEDWVTGEIAYARACHVFRIRSAFSCGVRLYNTAAARTADLGSGRMPPVLPASGSGVLAETWLSSGNGWDQRQSSVPLWYNGDAPAVQTFYWAIYSQMTAETDITVTLTVLPVET